MPLLSNNFYAEFFNSNPFSILVVNKKGEVFHVNSKFEDTFGFSLKEIKGKPIDIIIPEYLKAKYQVHFDKYKKNHTTCLMGEHLDLKALTKSGVVIPVDISLNPIKSDNETFYVATIVDVGLSIKKKEYENRVNLYDSITSSANVGVWSVDVPKPVYNSDDINALRWGFNTMFLSQLGFGLSNKLTFEKFIQILHPEDKKNSLEALKNALNGIKNFEQHFRIVRPDDSVRHIVAKGVLSINSSKEVFPIKIEGVTLDVTDTVEAQKLIEMSRSRLGNFFDLAPIGIVRNSMDGTFVEVNPEFEKFSGYTKDELNELSYWDLTPKEYDEQEKTQLELLEARGSYGPYEKEYIHKNGQKYPVLLNGVVITDEEDGKNYIWSIIQDMTLTKMTQSELVQFKTFFAQSQEMMAILSPDYYIQKVNPKFIESLGYKKEELITKCYLDFVHPEDINSTKEKLKDYNQLKKVEFLNQYKTKSGDYRWITWTFSINNLNKNHYIVAKDITEMVLAENKLKKLVKELESFVYATSHDLQEPLRVISSYLKLLQKKHKNNIDENGNELISRSINASERMKKSIDELLDYSRVGKENISKQQINFNELIQVVIANIQVLIDQNQAVFEIEDNIPTVIGNYNELFSVFINLFTNAIKYRKKEVTPVITVKSKLKHDKVIFSVADNGIGIEERFYERIFEVFQRLHTRNEYEGSGIGLAKLKKIIELHQGEIWLESEINIGTTFYFTLPSKPKK